jgi:hypothetical protein
VSINGGAVVETDDTDASGDYSLDMSFDLTAGDVITVFLQDEAQDAVTVSVSDGADLINFDLYQDYLITRHENNGSLTNTTLDTANNSGDTDIDSIYTLSGTALTVTSGVELLISGTFAPGDSVTANTIDIDGTFAMAANDITLSGTFDATSGVFSTTGTVAFTAISGTPEIISNNQSFTNIIFNDGGAGITFELEDALDVDGTLRIAGGTLDTKSTESNSITVGSNWLNEDIFLAQTGTVTFDPTATVDVVSNASAFNNIVVNGSGTVELEDALDVDGTLRIAAGTLDTNGAENYSITISGNWLNQATFIARSGTVTFDPTVTVDLTSNASSFNNVVVNGSGTVEPVND